jgi:hypothetical protein
MGVVLQSIKVLNFFMPLDEPLQKQRELCGIVLVLNIFNVFALSSATMTILTTFCIATS